MEIFVFNSCPPDAALRIWKSDPTVPDAKRERGLRKRIQDLTVQEAGLALRIFKLFFYLLGASLQSAILLPPVSTFVFFVPYQRGDSSVPLALRNLQRSSTILKLEFDLTLRSKKLLCDGRVPKFSREVKRRVPMPSLKVDVTSSLKELLCDGLMTIYDGEVEWRVPILFLKIDVTARSKVLLCDGRVPLTGREVERWCTSLHLKIDVTASSNELLRDRCKATCGSGMESCEPFRVLKIDLTTTLQCAAMNCFVTVSCPV